MNIELIYLSWLRSDFRLVVALRIQDPPFQNISKSQNNCNG